MMRGSDDQATTTTAKEHGNRRNKLMIVHYPDTGPYGLLDLSVKLGMYAWSGNTIVS
jgi:hypothetical protein